MAFYGKIFMFQSSENHDAFLKTLGLPIDTIALFTSFKPDQKIEKSGNNYIFTFISPQGEKPLPLTSGTEFEDQARDLKIKNTITVDDNNVTNVIKLGSDLVITAKKQFSATKMVEEITNSKWDGGVAYVTYYA